MFYPVSVFLSSCAGKASIVCDAPAAGGRKLVVLGMGGTIAGRADDATDLVAYRAGELGVDQILAGVAVPAGQVVETEQVCQIDSKDLGPAHWQRLVAAVTRQLDRADVAAVLITHGTDTLEETAYLLQRVLAPTKPVVLTAAMRPATALEPDGPRNLADALVTAAELAGSGRGGVVLTMAGQVFAGTEVSKQHSHHLDAFTAGDAGPLALVEDGRLRLLRTWPAREPALGARLVTVPVALWPQVEIVLSHSGANGRVVKLLMTAGVDGIVVAGTGNGTLHTDLEAALLKADRSGVKVLRSTRCAAGGVIEATGSAAGAEPAGAAAAPNVERRIRSAGALTPVQARVELLLMLLAKRAKS
ncbi:MAG: asparaginase [Burkholderiales bacterium]|nr:asparaginase [Burkholderiales bacterium]